MKPRNFVISVGLMCACLTVFFSYAPMTKGAQFIGPEQEKVSLTSDELQRLIYSSHVLTVIDDKPELEAALLALRELHSLNPDASPSSLVTPVRGALEEYRREAKSRALLVTWRDEVLARYFLILSKHREVPGRRQVLINLLKVLLADQDLPALLRQQYVAVYAADQRFLAVERGPGERQALVESCMQRAHSDPNFTQAMDKLLEPDVEVAVNAPLADILDANPALSQSPTMKELMRLSLSSADGCVEVTMDKLKGLFVAEVAVAKEAVTTHLDLSRNIDRVQEQSVRYPDKADEVAAIIQRDTEEQARQAKHIAASSSAARALSKLAIPSAAGVGKKIEGISKSLGFLGSGYAQIGAGGVGGVLGGCCSIIAAAGQAGAVTAEWTAEESPDEVILNGIKLVGDMISDLSEEMESRFDRVDRSLVYILRDLRSEVLLIGEVGHDVHEVRKDLLEVQANLHRLESQLHDELKAGFDEQLVEDINLDLGFEALRGEFLPEEWYWAAENKFYSLAVDHARNKLRSNFPTQDGLTDDKQLLDQLKKWPLESNLNYINQFLNKRLKIPLLSGNSLPGLPDWYVAANAYLQLAVENPQLFRNMLGSQKRLDEVIKAGTELEDFFSAMGDRKLYDVILSYYEDKLNAFDKAVDNAEERFGRNERFNVPMWRQWETRVPRIAIADTAVIGRYCLRRLPTNVKGIAAGYYHSLAIGEDGTVVAWGENEYGQCDVPAGLCDVVAVSAGLTHSLALKEDGTIVAWGDNRYKQCEIPVHKNIKKITAGLNHNLALGSDGEVIAWGDNRVGACDVPDKALANIVDIAADSYNSLALKDDGTVVAWGRRSMYPPSRSSNFVVIDAGYGRVVGVEDDGTVVDCSGGVFLSRGRTRSREQPYRDLVLRSGVTGITAVALGENFTLALKKDGTLEVIAGSLKGTPDMGGFVAIAAGGRHALALREDGTLVAWGDNSQGQCALGDGTKRVVNIASSGKALLLLMEDGSVTSLGIPVPSDLVNVVAIASGGPYHLALKADGTIREWRWPTQRPRPLVPTANITYIGGQGPENWLSMPGNLRDVVAIGAGFDMENRTLDWSHRLALRANGAVEGWGYNWPGGQAKVPPDLGSVVAIAPGYCSSMALRPDGTVVGWGGGFFGLSRSEVPRDLPKVVAIARGYTHNLALTVNGEVKAWGSDTYGQRTEPNEAKSNVVAIAAGEYRSLALKTDGTVVAWGRNREPISSVPRVEGLPEQYGTVAAWKRSGQGHCDFASAQTGVLAMACGGYYRDWFLVSATTPSIESTELLHFVRGEPPRAVMYRLRALCAHVLDEFDLDLKNSLNELTGAKVLLESVVALGLPDSLDQDDVLRGFLFGSESLIDKDGAHELYEAELTRLQTDEWRCRASTLEETPKARLESFRRQLYTRLDGLEKYGTPEIPRMVAHTLLQLRLLRAAY